MRERVNDVIAVVVQPPARWGLDYDNRCVMLQGIGGETRLMVQAMHTTIFTWMVLISNSVTKLQSFYEIRLNDSGLETFGNRKKCCNCHSQSRFYDTVQSCREYHPEMQNSCIRTHPTLQRSQVPHRSNSLASLLCQTHFHCDTGQCQLRSRAICCNRANNL